MKKLSTMALLWLCSFYYLYASDTPPAAISFISQETTTLSGQLTLRLRLYALTEMRFTTTPILTLPAGWQITSVTASSPVSSLTANDSLDFLVSVTYPIAAFPFFPVALRADMNVSETVSGGTYGNVNANVANTQVAPLSANTFTVTTPILTTGRVYFTLYNTVEVWEEGDFQSLPRVWLSKGSLKDTTRTFKAKSSIPVSDLTRADSVVADWQDDFQLLSVPGLPYMVRMKAVHPDIIATDNNDDGPDSLIATGSSANGRLFGKTFSGVIRGRLITRKSERGVESEFGLAGILIKLKEIDKIFNEEFAEVTTDANGFFEIRYSVNQSGLEGSQIEPFLKIKSINRTHNISVKEQGFLGSTYDLVIRDGMGNVGQDFSLDLGNVVLNDEHWRLLHWTVRAWDYVESQNLPLFSGMSIVPYRKKSNATPDGLLGISLPGTNPTIRIRTGSGLTEGTIRHEFGHFVMWCLQNKGFILALGNHSWQEESNAGLAWSEGWADAFEMILDGVFWQEDGECGLNEDGRFYEFRETFQAINRGVRSEYNIACALYDLWDGADKNLPLTIPNSVGLGGGTRRIGWNDLDANNAPIENNWTRADNVSLSLYQIARPLQLRSGFFNKINHINEYFVVLVSDVITENNCNLMAEISNCFQQNRVVYDIAAYNAGQNSGMSADVLYQPISESSIDFYINPYFTPATPTFDFIPNNTTSVILQDNLWLRGTAGNNNRLNLNPLPTYTAAATFSTCGNVEIDLTNAALALGGASASATLNVNSGALIHLREGGTLVINNNSTVVINCGARLIIEPGYGIQLNGPNARLIINGVVETRNGAVLNVPFTQTTPAVSGPASVSAAGAAYTVNIAGADAYTWTVPAGWRINGQPLTSLTINGSAGASVTIQPPAACGGGAQQVCVQVSGCTLGQACLSVSPPSAPVLAGMITDVRGSRALIDNAGNSVPANTNVTATITTAGLSSPRWQFYAGQVASYSGNGATLQLRLNPYRGATFTFTANSNCGPVSKIYSFYNVSGGTFALYPLPADDELTVEELAQTEEWNSQTSLGLIQTNGQQRAQADTETDLSPQALSTEALALEVSNQENKSGFEVSLYDNLQRKLKTARTKGHKTKLDVSYLPEGSYYLHIVTAHETIRRQVYIKK